MLFKILNLRSNLSIIEQLFAVFAGSIISTFIRPHWISSGVENIGIAGNGRNGFSWIYTKIMQIQEGRPNLKSVRGFGLTY